MEGVLTGRAESLGPCCLLLGRASTELLLPRLHLKEIHPWLEAFNLSVLKHLSSENLVAHLFSSCFQALQSISLQNKLLLRGQLRDLLLMAFVQSNGWVEGAATAWIRVSLSLCRVGTVCVHL